MKYTYKATTRVLSLILVVILMFTALPTSAFAAIDEPLNGVTGDGWDSFGGLAGEESAMPPIITKSPTNGDTSDTGHPDSEDAITNKDDTNSSSIERESEAVATPTTAPIATAGTLGASGITLDLPADVLADFITFMGNAEEAIESPYQGIKPLAGIGDTGTISWSWGETANFNAGGYYCNQIPTISLSTTRPSEGRPFCAMFGPDPLTGGTYKAAEHSNPTILKLLIAHKEGKASAVGVQLAVWSITNNASAFATHPEAAAALSAASSVNTDGYTLLKWTTSGSYQPFFTLEKNDVEPVEWKLKIIKKAPAANSFPALSFQFPAPE